MQTPSEPNMAQIYKEVYDRLYGREPVSFQERITEVNSKPQVKDSAVDEWVKKVCAVAENKYEAQNKAYYQAVQNKVLNKAPEQLV